MLDEQRFREIIEFQERKFTAIAATLNDQILLLRHEINDLKRLLNGR